MGKHGAAAPHTDTDTHAYAEPNSIDLADSFCVTDTDSDVQRGTLAHVTTADPSHIRVSDANAKPDRNVLTRIVEKEHLSGAQPSRLWGLRASCLAIPTAQARRLPAPQTRCLRPAACAPRHQPH